LIITSHYLGSFAFGGFKRPVITHEIMHITNKKTHRAGRNGHTGRLPVNENANQVTAFLRSLANLPSLLSLERQSHCVSPIEMKHVPPYFILDMPSRFECRVQNLLGQAPAASSLHALRPARGQCLV